MIRLEVDRTNPGQFFACCGLFELAHRLWPETTGHFEGAEFMLSQGELKQLVEQAATATLTSLVPSDKSASPMALGDPFSLRLDWWKDRAAGDATLKPWAGTMLALRIGQAMQGALSRCLEGGRLFDVGFVVTGPDGKKVEPYYFDARRGANALPLDLGFSPDALKLEAVGFPATEFFTLVGLQRFRPAPAPRRPRVFRYRAWSTPFPVRLAALAMGLALPTPGGTYQFENAFRTDQRKHKAFSPAVPVNGDRNE
ncbi:MAG: hypothetical protein HYZ28_14235 [Myxococcales bacterium]|nr:hypothetical protein [Myxococcales bacterium]